MWVEGYWYPQGKKHYKWHDGYWTRAPYEGAYWVAPYYGGGQYYAGRWEGGRGTVGHDHGWDKSKQRDEGRNPHSGKSKSKQSVVEAECKTSHAHTPARHTRRVHTFSWASDCGLDPTR
jgi:hypothetical protein